VSDTHVRPWHFLDISLLLWVTVVVGFLGWQIYAYSFESYTTGDAAIVLGAAVWGNQPSPVFEERIRHAVHLYKQNNVQALVFTGGRGLNDRRTEAEVAKAYALERGVADADTYCETNSRITWGNLLGARDIIETQRWERVLIVSDPLHMKRAVTMARDLGMPAYPAPTPTTRYRSWRTKGRFLIRETYFYTIYLLQRGLHRQKAPLGTGPFLPN
jgi:uncharacterized SAM-binding protein YcdF (DUF218 family)